MDHQTLAPNYKQKRNTNPRKSIIRRSKSISNNSSAPLLNPTPHSLHPHYQQPPLLPLPKHYPLLSHKNYGEDTTLPRARTMSLITTTQNKPRPGTTMRPTHYSSFSSELLTPKHHHHLTVVSTHSSLSSTSTTSSNNNVIGHGMLSSISSAYNSVLSPPPSSLPLPKFCMRSKLSFKAKTACADVGPTQDLSQVLRLK